MVNEIRKDGLPPSLCPLPKRDWTLGWLCLAGTGWKNQISIPKIWVLSLLFCPKHEKTQIEPESKKKQGEPDTRSKQGKRICKREQQGWESNSPSACERRGGGLNSRDGSWAGVSIVISTLWNWLRWGPSVLQWFRLGLIGLQWLVKRLMSGSFPVMQKAPILARIESLLNWGGGGFERFPSPPWSSVKTLLFSHLSSPRPRNLGRVDGGFLVESSASSPYGPVVESLNVPWLPTCIITYIMNDWIRATNECIITYIMNAFIALFSYMHCVCASSSSVEMTRRENKSDNDVITYIIYAWSAKA